MAVQTSALPTICLACSQGGHTAQMLELAEFYTRYPHFFVTEKTGLSHSLPEGERAHYLKLINRRMFTFPLRFVYNTLRCVAILAREKPDIVVSTGALCTVPLCFLAKWTGRRVVFIESYAKVNTPTLSGRLVYRIADLFIVQWEALRASYPRAVYGGSIY